VIIDAPSVPSGTIVDADVCIIGAGAAGITLAREFINSPFRVVLLESGGMEYEQETQNLYEGQSIGQSFKDLTACRLRYFGGTTNIWGGWCLPLDAIDFEPRDDLPNHGWPFPKSHLDPWYRRAQRVCQLGPYDYRPSSWGITPDKVPPPFSGPDFECKILQENYLRFGPVYASALREAPQTTTYLHANAFNLATTENGRQVKELAVKTLSGNEFAVRARIYVLATGGIENARLLLASGKEGGAGVGNAHDLVGRFLMVHLVYPGGVIIPVHPRMTFDFRTHVDHSFLSFIGLTAESMRRRHLPNIMIHWSYNFSPVKEAADAVKRLADLERSGGSWLADLSTVVHNFEGLAEFGTRKVLFGEGVPVEAMPVGCASEQQPNPQSRISLGHKVDRLGMREVVVDWQLVPEDKNGAAETLKLLALEVGRSGFGRLHPLVTEDGPWPEGFLGDQHHMGTTRMHRDPKLGVVDENCRVHSVANLYVAGSSVFPSTGASNPTLTIVAIALRLADHVKKQLT
jgi:choline dehydrogenase-like flavoprotein